jgi:ATP-binding cassette subfamily B (MDR/TAP) protein 1
MENPKLRHLFAFTTRRSILTLLPALIFSLLSGTVVPMNSFLVGKIFSKFTAYGEGQISVEEFKKEVVKYILYIVAMGAGCWLCNAMAYTLWHTFGGIQGHCARERVFDALIDRPMEWYDRRKDGVKGLSTRLQS